VSLAALTTFVIGLRHGVDWDHLAAITDITGSEVSRRRGAVLALVYAAGHGAVVLVLGLLAVAAGTRLPEWIDPAMERVVGATLVILGAALLVSLSRGRATSRGAVLFTLLATARERLRRNRVVAVEHAHAHDHTGLHRHDEVAAHGGADRVRTMHRHIHRHQVTVSQYGVGGALAVGALHGVGAETGTQAVVLVSAGSAHGLVPAVGLIIAFGLGVFVTTAVTALVAAAGWTALGSRTSLFRGLTVAAAVISVLVGGAFLTGHGDSLPPIISA
jgi:high-affinity nickel permease